MRILVTTTSFQDTPGAHHDVLRASGFEIVPARGPLTEAQLLALIAGDGFDGLLNGDDAITARVIDAALPRLRVIAKYGIGLDSIDVAHATARSVPVLFTPGVNHTTVAEHTFGLMIALAKQFWPHLRSTKAGQWQRLTGTELAGKRLALLGLGRIGKEVARRAAAFDMQVVGHDPQWDDAFARTYGVVRSPSLADAARDADVISLHMNLGDGNRRWLDHARIATFKRGALVINTARGGLVDEQALADALKNGIIGGAGFDVLTKEPPKEGNVLLDPTLPNFILTPHVAWASQEAMQILADQLIDNIEAFVGGSPQNVVE
jgi:D-3-phosphoglycerate dehydrogenase